jgi:hypothetical protein
MIHIAQNGALRETVSDGRVVRVIALYYCNA